MSQDVESKVKEIIIDKLGVDESEQLDAINCL